MYRYSIFNPKEKLSERCDYREYDKLQQEKKDKKDREEMAKEDKPINTSD